MDMGDMNFDIKPTDDYVFKRLYFLPKVHDLKYENNEITKDFCEGRNGRLDVKATTDNGDIVDIEIQSIDTGNLMNRGIFYNSWLMSTNARKGSNLEDIPRVISIWIIKNEPKKDNIFYNHKSPIELNNIKSEVTKFDKESLTTSDKFNIIFIFLSKFKEGMLNKNLENWIKFIDNQNITNVTDEDIIKAIRKMDYFRGDKNMKEAYESRMKFILNYNSDMIFLKKQAHEEGLKKGKEEGLKEGREEGKKEGLKKGKEEGLKEGKKEGLKKGKEEGLKEGREEGKKEGLKKGKEEGLKEGEKKSKIEIAKNMLKEGLDVNLISKLSGLIVGEIINLDKK